MVVVETPVFTNRVLEILSDDEYRELQLFLVAHPEAGDVIPGSNGLRKLRWKSKGKRKTRGARVIYFWIRPKETLLLLFLFKKNEQSDLTKVQLKQLRAVITKELQ